MENNESQPSGVEQISPIRVTTIKEEDSLEGMETKMKVEAESYNRFFKPSPVNAGEEHEINIESMSKRGDAGVGRIQGLVIFVPNTKVGDKVKVKVTRVGRGYATAELIEAKTEEKPHK